MPALRPLLACVALTMVAGTMVDRPTRAVGARRVAGNLVFWDQRRGFDTILANADVFSEVSPFWYRVAADGRVVPYSNPSGGTYEDPGILSFLRAHGILMIPTVANIINGTWDGPLVSRILSDPHLLAYNITNLVNLAIGYGYDGIDLDYEDLPASDRTAFTTFVQALAAALHAEGKLLTVNVYAKTSEPGTWDGPMAQDWWALGQAADAVRIMTYEYSWSTSPPGPISPVHWVRDVIAFARTRIPPQKIMQGIPFYGYDWVGQRGTDLVWTDATALANTYAAPINWDRASASPWFEYVAGSSRHTVWFENAASINAKLDVTMAYDLGGITLWRLGGEDPGNFTALRSRLGGTPPAPDLTPPVVAITSPDDGAWLTKKQLIEARASDNVQVARVDFHVNGSLLAADTTAPYAVWWNTNRAVRGANRIDVYAYDASGNSARAEATAYSRR